MDTTSSSLRRVGYWFSEKKNRKLNLKELTEVFRGAGLELIKLDLDCSLEDQGPFSAIVHKLSDFILRAQEGDAYSKKICDAFLDYQVKSPHMVVIDAFPNIKKLLDRYRQYQLVESCEVCLQDKAFVPAYVEMTTLNISENLEKMQKASVDFPIVCKPSATHTRNSHQMSLIFNSAGLADLRIPCVAQQFIPHNGVLFKLFILGEKYVCMERPSLRNFYKGDRETIFFDSNISKPYSSSSLTELEVDLPPVIAPSQDLMNSIVQQVHSLIGLDLVGIDLIVHNETGHTAIIDVNVFPGYHDVEDYYQLLSELVLQKILEKEKNLPKHSFNPTLVKMVSTRTLQMNAKSLSNSSSVLSSHDVIPYSDDNCLCCPISDVFCNGHKLSDRCPDYLYLEDNGMHDSGVETSDSCDEKKNKMCSKNVKYQHSKQATKCPTAFESI